jgi:2-dehydro-3-deoxy-D-arabinonate dehydratase
VRLCRFVIDDDNEPHFGLALDEGLVDLARVGGPRSLADAMQLPAAELLATLKELGAAGAEKISSDAIRLLAPLDEQEVWAAGVTYLRSRDARMEESTQRDVYDLVYDADRPEIFFKATPNRVSGPGEPIAIRADSGWDVPEPELVLALNAHGEAIGYTIGNDVSSRSIEGENPLYLPQAKLYSRSAALGPTIVTVDELTASTDLAIELTISRGDETLFRDATSTARLHRPFGDLVEYLFRANDFPAGVFLMTGTGIVPPSEFTLQDGDEVTISIAGVGSLVNPVVRLDP